MMTTEFGGLGLSDDLAVPGKWTFPIGSVVGPRGELLVWLDGEPGDLQAAQRRLLFLRERGGGANGYALAAAAKGRTEADAEAAAERERSEVAQAEAVAEALAEGASEAIGRLAASLLETDFTATPRARSAARPAK